MTRRIFAIGDLHLSSAQPKPMDIFGPEWEDHAANIAANWRAAVAPSDLVLVAGDISWALKLPAASPDLAWLADLPGEKVLVRGNHDYWWSSISKVRQAAPAGMHFIQNDAVVLTGVGIGGTRLWDFPEVRWPLPALDAGPANQDEPEAGKQGNRAPVEEVKIRRREMQRLQLSLRKIPSSAGLRIALVHYPPLGADGKPSPVTDLIREAEIDICVFGHVHGLGREINRPGADCMINGTRYVLCSCDWLGFRPLQVASV